MLHHSEFGDRNSSSDVVIQSETFEHDLLKLAADIHAPKRMKHPNFSDPCSFSWDPSVSWSLILTSKISELLLEEWW